MGSLEVRYVHRTTTYHTPLRPEQVDDERAAEGSGNIEQATRYQPHGTRPEELAAGTYLITTFHPNTTLRAEELPVILRASQLRDRGERAQEQDERVYDRRAVDAKLGQT